LQTYLEGRRAPLPLPLPRIAGRGFFYGVTALWYGGKAAAPHQRFYRGAFGPRTPTIWEDVIALA
jgi:hypothetical protein